jgi:hypothetical protein
VKGATGLVLPLVTCVTGSYVCTKDFRCVGQQTERRQRAGRFVGALLKSASCIETAEKMSLYTSVYVYRMFSGEINYTGQSFESQLVYNVFSYRFPLCQSL